MKEDKRVGPVCAGPGLKSRKPMDGQERGATGGCGLCGQVPEEGETFSHCARCKVVAYCSRACQVNHWKGGHKKECCAPPEAQEPVKALTKAPTKTKGGAAKQRSDAGRPPLAV